MGAMTAALYFFGATETVALWISVLGAVSLFASCFMTGALLIAHFNRNLNASGKPMLFWGSTAFVSLASSLFTVGLVEVLLQGALAGTVSVLLFYAPQFFQKIQR